MSNETQVFIDRISKWMNKKINKYISMMIKYTEKIETNIKSELHEGTKWIHKTKQKHVLQKYFTKIVAVMIRTFTCDSPSTIIAPMHSQCSYPVSYAIRLSYKVIFTLVLLLS